jgi:HxlR-like helix-turn-helix
MTESPRARRVIDLLDGRRTVQILAQLSDGGRRHQDVSDDLEGVSLKVLTDTFRETRQQGPLATTPSATASPLPSSASWPTPSSPGTRRLTAITVAQVARIDATATRPPSATYATCCSRPD